MDTAFEAKLELKDNSLLLQLSGRYDRLRLLQVIMEVGRQCEQTGCRSVLADARQHVGGIEVMELHQIGELIARELPRGSHVALVASPGRLAMDRFLETVAVNRGVLFRLFTELEDAQRWLQRTSSRSVARDAGPNMSLT